MTFPENNADCLQLATELVGFLRANLGETHTRPEWTAQVFERLDRFAGTKELDAFHKESSRGRREFLWDWTAFQNGSGLVIACESEWSLDLRNHRRDPKHDLEKLLSACCPVKLFVFWASEEKVSDAVKELTAYANENCGRFQPGSVLILYCINPQTTKATNQDQVWKFQAAGDFNMSSETVQMTPV